MSTRFIGNILALNLSNSMSCITVTLFFFLAGTYLIHSRINLSVSSINQYHETITISDKQKTFPNPDPIQTFYRSQAGQDKFHETITISDKQKTFPNPDLIQTFYRSQAGQDKWIFENVMHSDFDTYRQRSGIFIEFGARDGAEHSNTYFFEHFLGWKGLLIEANPTEVSKIHVNRPSSACIHGAICSSEYITFFDTGILGVGGDKSTFDRERYGQFKDKAKEFQVKCYTLDYLTSYFHMTDIDFMSVDTEGSELAALQTFPFDRLQPKLIAVEILTGNTERNQYRETLLLFMKTKGYQVFHEYWVDRRYDTLDLFFTLDGKVPIFNNEAMSRDFQSKVIECQEADLCLK